MMKLMNMFHHFFKKQPTVNASATLGTLVLLTESQDGMLNCDQVFELIDQFSERAALGEDVAHLMPLIQAHLDMCPDCREHYEALMRVLAAK
jgi:hypothetical protein